MFWVIVGLTCAVVSLAVALHERRQEDRERDRTIAGLLGDVQSLRRKVDELDSFVGLTYPESLCRRVVLR